MSNVETGAEVLAVKAMAEDALQGKEGVDDEEQLEVLVKSLPLGNRAELYQQLRHIRRKGHLFHHQWRGLKETLPDLVDTSFEVLRKYESNGLQLSGQGCWFFEQVVVSVGLSLSCSKKFTEEQMLEMILRVLLEHKTYPSCCHVLFKLCVDEPKHFISICEIGEYYLSYDGV